MPNKLDPLEWMEKHVQHRTWGWEELVNSGRAPLEELKNSPLKEAVFEGFMDTEDNNVIAKFREKFSTKNPNRSKNILIAICENIIANNGEFILPD